MLRIEDHNSVALLQRLREALASPEKRKRKGVFNGLRDALKGLGLVTAKEPIEGLWEGIDSAGGHWFAVELRPIPSTSSPLPKLWLSLTDSLVAKVSELCEIDETTEKELRNKFLGLMESYVKLSESQNVKQ